MDIVERLRKIASLKFVDRSIPTDVAEAADEIERLRSRLENPTEEMLEAGRAANRLVAGNALGLACIAPDAAWRVMADMILSRSE
jgi:hypothetical protein